MACADWTYDWFIGCLKISSSTRGLGIPASHLLVDYLNDHGDDFHSLRLILLLTDIVYGRRSAIAYESGTS